MKHNEITNPKHYDLFPDEQAIDIIERALTPEEYEGYLKGNVLKYRLRAGQKGDAEKCLAKAEWYRSRLFELAEAYEAIERLSEMAFKHTPSEAEALCDEYAHDLTETQKIFDQGEKRADDIGQNGNDGGAYPLTKEELSADNWYCLQHDEYVQEALISLGVQVWEEPIWKKGLWYCCMLDGHKVTARPYGYGVFEEFTENNQDAYEIRLINGQFYRA